MREMNRLVDAFHDAMESSKGSFPEACTILADAMQFDDELQLEVAMWTIGTMLQPGRGALERAFKADTGKTFDEFVSRQLQRARERVG